MPKLAADMAREAEQAAEEDSFALIPAGLYIGKLESVEVSDEPGASGFHYWTWNFRIQDEGYTHSRQTFITSLSPKARFSVGGAFKAFGVPADTHTDDLLGHLATLQVTQATITKGTRAGQIGNSVQFIAEYDGSLDPGGESPLDSDF